MNLKFLYYETLLYDIGQIAKEEKKRKKVKRKKKKKKSSKK